MNFKCFFFPQDFCQVGISKILFFYIPEDMLIKRKHTLIIVTITADISNIIISMYIGN